MASLRATVTPTISLLCHQVRSVVCNQLTVHGTIISDCWPTLWQAISMTTWVVTLSIAPIHTTCRWWCEWFVISGRWTWVWCSSHSTLLTCRITSVSTLTQRALYSTGVLLSTSVISSASRAICVSIIRVRSLNLRWVSCWVSSTTLTHRIFQLVTLDWSQPSPITSACSITRTSRVIHRHWWPLPTSLQHEMPSATVWPTMRLQVHVPSSLST